MDNLTIGVLLPSSNIFPIAKDFEKGLKQGLKPLAAAGIELELVKEFIGSGDPKSVETACNKLLNFDDATAVTGVLSGRTVSRIADLFRNKETALLVNDLGEYIPDIKNLNSYITINSMYLWRHAWALGDWGVKTFGAKGMFTGATYDSGYSFSHMFHEGMKAGDKYNDWSFSVPPTHPETKFSEMHIIFPFIEQYQPDFIFAAFCGTETSMFLNELIGRGWHHKIKVMGLPYLVSPIKQPLNDDITIYTTQPFENAPEIEAANAFYHLGLQTGRNIAAVAKDAATKQDLAAALAQQNNLFNITSPFAHADMPVGVLQNNIDAGTNSFTSLIIDNLTSLPIKTDVLEPLTPTQPSGWFNTYLAI